MPVKESFFASNKTCKAAVLPRVASAREAFELATSTVTMFGGKLNLSKEEAVYPVDIPLQEYFGGYTLTRVFLSLNLFWEHNSTWSYVLSPYDLKEAYLHCSLSLSGRLATSQPPWVEQCSGCWAIPLLKPSGYLYYKTISR